MKTKKCFNCYGYGKNGRVRCSVCHGKKYVTVDWSKWNMKRNIQISKLRNEADEVKRCYIENNIKIWEKKHPKPRKFIGV